MKAEKTNHLLRELGFLINGWDSEIKNGSIVLAHMISSFEELTELERLAKIGEATEKWFKENHIMEYTGVECYSVEDLLEWAESEGK